MFNIESFIKEKYAQILSFVESSGMSRHDAEDATQDIFVSLNSKYNAGAIDPNKCLSAYLYQLTRWRIIDKFRRIKTLTKDIIEIGDDNNLDELAAQNIDNEWKKQLLIKAAAEIKNEVNPKYHKLFIEQAINNESAAFSAEKYNTTIPVAHLAKHRVGKKVILAARKILKENGV